MRYPRHASRRSAAFILALALLAAGPARALETELDAGVIAPLGSPPVQLVSMKVRAWLPTGSDAMLTAGRATSTFRLRNLSESPQTFPVVFLTGPPAVPLRGNFKSHYLLARPHLQRAGGDLPGHWEVDGPGKWDAFARPAPDTLPAWTLTLQPRETAEYQLEQDIAWGGVGAEGRAAISFSCVASPAAAWADSVDETEVSFVFDGVTAKLLSCVVPANPCLRFRVDPPGAAWKRDTLRWTRGRGEPRDDFHIRLDWQVDE